MIYNDDSIVILYISCVVFIQSCFIEIVEMTSKSNRANFNTLFLYENKFSNIICNNNQHAKVILIVRFI